MTIPTRQVRCQRVLQPHAGVAGLILDTSAGWYQPRTLSYEGPPPQQFLTLLPGQNSTHFATAVHAQPLYRTPQYSRPTGDAGCAVPLLLPGRAAHPQPAAAQPQQGPAEHLDVGKAQGLSPHHLKAGCRAPSQLPTTSRTSQTPRDTSYLAGFHSLACLLGEHSGILCLGELAGAEPNHSADVLLRGLQQANHNRPNVLHRHPIHGGVPHGQCCMGEIDFTQSAGQPSTQSTGTTRVFGTQPLNARGGRAKGTHQRGKSGKHLQD